MRFEASLTSGSALPIEIASQRRRLPARSVLRPRGVSRVSVTTTAQNRIHLSPPDVGLEERAALLRAFDSNWIAPIGPEVDAFEEELALQTGAEACVVLSSGSAALHLALLVSGVQEGDEVVVQTTTFAASAFSVAHARGVPVFCDVDRKTWNLDPELLEEFLKKRASIGRLPKAVIAVDLYGACADYERLEALCRRFDVRLIEDAAEALGSQSGGRMAGSFGSLAAVSFNGNKIITTSGGGALLGPARSIARARHLASQARLPGLHYEHAEIGFNYRMSNLLAALGRAQLAGLEDRIERREFIYRRYCDGLPFMKWMPSGVTERPNRWLTVGLLPDGCDPVRVCRHLAAAEIEARPSWKPMHLQRAFHGALVVGGQTADSILASGICLPSGSSLTASQQQRVIDVLGEAVGV